MKQGLHFAIALLLHSGVNDLGFSLGILLRPWGPTVARILGKDPNCLTQEITEGYQKII